MKPEDRLIVAADFKSAEGHGAGWVKAQVLRLAEELRGTGVYLKVNSALRAHGYGLIRDIQSCGLKVFADLKLFDISETLEADGLLLEEARPELLTVVCASGVASMHALKKQLRITEVLGVTVLTSFKQADMDAVFGRNLETSVQKFAVLAEAAGLDGLVCAPTDITSIKGVIERPMTFNTPAIRPTWAIVPGDDQNPERVMTPARAIKAGATRIVVGRPITNSGNSRDAVMRTLEEIHEATK